MLLNQAHYLTVLSIAETTHFSSLTFWTVSQSLVCHASGRSFVSVVPAGSCFAHVYEIDDDPGVQVGPKALANGCTVDHAARVGYY